MPASAKIKRVGFLPLVLFSLIRVSPYSGRIDNLLLDVAVSDCFPVRVVLSDESSEPGQTIIIAGFSLKEARQSNAAVRDIFRRAAKAASDKQDCIISENDESSKARLIVHKTANHLRRHERVLLLALLDRTKAWVVARSQKQGY
jgi:hypothetical protein